MDSSDIDPAKILPTDLLAVISVGEAEIIAPLARDYPVSPYDLSRWYTATGDPEFLQMACEELSSGARPYEMDAAIRESVKYGRLPRSALDVLT